VSLDRTKPPPRYWVERGSDGLWDAWCDLTEFHRVGYESEAEALKQAWAIYDAITLPAREALLRELAAELLSHRESFGAFLFGESHVYAEVADELTKRADALEKP